MKKIYLVDVSSMFFRAFFALPHLTNEKGMPTNALYGFLAMTIKLLRDIKPEYMAFCFDTKEPSFRHELYSEYKANRDEMPADLVPQVPYVEKLTECLGIPRVIKPGFEADDLIGTLTARARHEGLEVVIVSGDKDFAQLIGPLVTMHDTMKDVRYDPPGVLAKWGVRPEQMIDYLALVGDSSDNVPGVKGIGPKGAQKLLHEYQTLEGVYQNLDKITGKALKGNLEQNKEMAFLSQRLVTIHTEVDVGVKVQDLKLTPIDREKLGALLLELGFKNFAKNLLSDSLESAKAADESSAPVSVANPVASNVSANAAPGAANARPSGARKSGRGPVVLERMTLAELEKFVEPYSEVWGMLTERGLYLGCNGRLVQVEAEALDIGRTLSRKLIKWSAFDLKDLWRTLKVTEPQASWDQHLAAYVLRAGPTGNFAELYELYCGGAQPDLPTPEDHFRMQLELEDQLRSHLHEVQGESVLEKIELPLVPILYGMEAVGIEIDVESLKAQSRDLETDIRQIEKAIHAEAGGPFNIASPKQLAQILFGKLGLPPGKKTKTGYSTDSDVLDKLAESHPIAKMIIEYRELAKLKSTYVDALPQLLNAETHRIHTHFNQAGTATGRLSSVNPNLQNIPIRTERGRMVRNAFVARTGCQLIAADYSQIELRILAHMSDDPAMQAAFADDLDIHTATASEIYGVPLGEVKSEMRRMAKAVNFGIAYGQGAFGLAETLGIGRGEAAEIIERYFKRFVRVKQYMDDTIKAAMQTGYVETLFGRRRYLDELKSKNQAVRKFGERAAINAPIQGTASDLVKMAMIQVHQDVDIPMLIQVHDELLFECPTAKVAAESERIRKIMEKITQLKVPLKVNVASGPNWEAAHS